MGPYMRQCVMLRRSFFSRFGVAAAALGFGDQTAAQSAAPTPSPAPPRWQPARHEQDDWFDTLPGMHRVLFDTWTAGRFGDSMLFSGNYYRANRDVYALADRDLAVVVCVRHQTAPFAFNDAMWAKYGKAFSKRMEWVDPKTQEPPSTNLYNRQLSNFVKQGMHIAVCNMTTKAYTQIIADQTHTSVDDVYKELTSNTIGNCHFVPAGVVAATRAQERGFTIISIG
jgi:intracellular sulfur oxidation DsrE/DsrF family protein